MPWKQAGDRKTHRRDLIGTSTCGAAHFRRDRKIQQRVGLFEKSINILGDKINESRKRKRKYEDMRISEIISRVKQEDSLISEKVNTEAILRELTSGSKDISLKYKHIEDSLRSATIEKRIFWTQNYPMPEHTKPKKRANHRRWQENRGQHKVPVGGRDQSLGRVCLRDNGTTDSGKSS